MRISIMLLALLGLMLAHALAWSVRASLHSRWVYRSVELSPDGEYLAKDTSNGSSLFFPATGYGLTVHSWPVPLARIGLDWSRVPSGSPPRFRIACHTDEGVWIARIEKDGLVDKRNIPTTRGRSHTPRLSADGARIAVIASNSLVVLDTTDGRELWHTKQEQADFIISAWSTDGAIIAAARHDRALRRTFIDVLDATSGDLLATHDTSLHQSCQFFEFMPRSRTLFTDLHDQLDREGAPSRSLSIELDDPTVPVVAWRTAPLDWSSAAFSSTGTTLAARGTGQARNTLAIWRFKNQTLTEVTRTPLPKLDHLTSFAFTHGDSSLRIALSDGSVVAMDPATGAITHVTSRYREPHFATWQIVLFGSFTIWTIAWFAVGRYRERESAGPRPRYWASTMTAACITLFIAGVAHAYAIQLSPHAPNSLDAVKLGVLAFGAVALTVFIMFIRQMRIMASLFATAGGLSIAVVYIMFFIEIVANV
jgi:hypothetical protein